MCITVLGSHRPPLDRLQCTLISVQEKQEDELINERRKQAREVSTKWYFVWLLDTIYVLVY